jgi:hypothetical protein
MTFIDRDESPFADFAVLGTMMDRAQALASPRRPTYLHIAEHIIDEDETVSAFLDREP